MRMVRSSALFLALAAATCSGAWAAAPLPPQLVAKLEDDRRRAEEALAAERSQLGEVATTQRELAAVHARAAERLETMHSVAKLAGMQLPDALDERAAEAVESWQQPLALADERLEVATRRTAAAQGRALDADRRLRALQRASATEDDTDTSIGSWTFGSGGTPVSAATVDAYLRSKGSPMAGQGAAFVEAGVESEVDPRLLVAIAGAESYFGITTCADFNAWGWGCPTRPQAFDDWRHAIRTVAAGLREGYLDDGLESVGEIHLRYAPPNASNDPTGLNFAWPDNVARFLVEQGGDPQQVGGVRRPSR